MKDFKAIFNTYSGRIKHDLGFKTELGKKFKEGGFEEDHEDYYLRMFFSKLSAMKNFYEFIKNEKFDSVLEIGCSTGLLPIIFSDIFSKKRYTGIDLSQKSLDIAKNNGPKEYIALLGIATWNPGQLDSEIKEGSWRKISSSYSLIFDNNSEKWGRLLNSKDI